MDGPRLPVDTIVARATPPGVGAIALIRLSGPRATDVAGVLTGCGDGEMADWAARQGRLRVLRDPRSGKALDRALVTVFSRAGQLHR